MLKSLLAHKLFRIPYSKFVQREYKTDDAACPMYIDLADVTGPSSHIVKGTIMSYETENIKLLGHYLEPGKVMLDIGANIGHYAVLLGKDFPKATIYSFEPHPFAHSLLEKNLKLHALNNVRAFNLGLAKEKGTLMLYHNKKNSGGHSFVNGLNASEFTALKEVAVEKLDEFVKKNNIPKVDVIKIDVEGYEYEILLGAESLITTQRPVVMFEFTPHMYVKQGYDQAAPLNYFLSKNYSLFDLERKRDFTSASELIKAMGTRPLTNIIAKPLAH